MPGKHRKRPKGPALEPVPSEILDHFVGQGPITAEELETTVRRFKKAVIERALGGELTHHLGYPAGGVASPNLPGGIFGVETNPGFNTEFPRVATAEAGGAVRAIIS